MKKYALSFLLLLGILQGASNVFASHMREESKSPDLSYSVMLRRSAGNTEDTTGNFMIASFGVIAADKKMQQNHPAEILSALEDIIKNSISLRYTPEQLFSKLAISFVNNDVPYYDAYNLLWKTITAIRDEKIKSKLLSGFQQFEKKFEQEYEKKIKQEQARKRNNFDLNAKIDEAIEKNDKQSFECLLKRAGYPETVIKQALANFRSGCHESVSFCDYDKKGNAV